MGFEGLQVSDDRRDWEEDQNGKREERKMFLGVYWEGFSVLRDKVSQYGLFFRFIVLLVGSGLVGRVENDSCREWLYSWD